MSSRQVSQMASPTRDRVRKLSERLNSIQSSFDSERLGRLDQLEKRFLALEEQLTDFAQQSSQKLNDVREKVVYLQKGLEAEKAGKEVEFDARLRNLETLEGRVQATVEQELNIRRDSELRTLKTLDERSGALRSEMVKETKAKNDSADAIKSILSSGLAKNQEGCKVALSDLNTLREVLNSKVEEESDSVQGLLSTERKARENTEEAMLAMLKDVVGRIKSDLEQERKDRESTEENLLSLLEDACAKLNAITQG